MARCIILIAGLAGWLATLYAAPPSEAVWTKLLNGNDTAGWVEEQHDFYRAKHPNTTTWTVRNGLVHCDGSTGNCGFLRYQRPLRDFVFQAEFRISAGCNSGIGFRSPQPYTGLKPVNTLPSNIGFEFQIMDDAGTESNDKSTGSIYGKLAPRVNAARPAGQWNMVEIECRGSRIRATLNGQRVQDFDYSLIPALEDRSASGYLSLQNHGHDIDFRNVQLRELHPPADVTPPPRRE